MHSHAGTKGGTRLVARTDHETQEFLAQAAELSGMTLSQFLIESARDKAERVVDQMTRIRVSVETGNRMLELLDHKRPRKPTSSKLIEDALDYGETINASETYQD
ncbi:DUF1778 domain-containing protein [Marinobacter nanhaiticus D15-8W]|uniref:DUF1778 domain-containing protein n=2 Tax=Marinobacter TaxID=2742 RepID=N6WZZ1_9GAMM|nr:DUF1778 domain-containing protein [Marinobacter nanhaiticus D15-8W]